MSKKKFEILIPQDIADPGKEYLRDKGYSVVVGSGYDPETIIREIKNSDAVIVRNFPFTRQMMEASPSLKVIGRHGVGTDNIDITAATDLGIQVVFAPQSNSLSVAEHVIGFIIESSHLISKCDFEVKRGNFNYRLGMQANDIQDKTLGIIGFGRIGRLVANKASLGLGMNVLYFDPFVSLPDATYKMAASLEELLKVADFITVHVPLTEETRDLIGRDQFDLMKSNAVVINTARGGIVNESELIEALRLGKIRHACLDVFEVEPLPSDSPLLTLENITLTPHSATLTEECLARMGTHAAQGIHEVLSGQNPTWPVNSLRK